MLLAIDTSTRWVGLALYSGAAVTGEMVWESQNHHTVEVAPALQTMLKRNGVAQDDLRAIGVALGPGSFTSLRIGLGLAKGLALALNIPVIGIPTLDILVAAQPVRDLPLAAVLQAGRGRLAVAWYKMEMLPRGHAAWRCHAEPAVMRAEELAQQIHRPTLVCGELSAEERQLLARKRKNVILASPASSVRRPAYLAELAWARWQAGKMDDPISLAPYYLHYGEAIPG
ncbi:MAG TPA: tRNA (adenosine(37)-N6)-threonylcarbamoyltransferase complex dimerization subunit type 1 TsaB [Anaerolineaceae bacterium]|nr:tRNA (adenosine(37)-N6)-threonylcarbamoyltransferase complex dimerization subunit type 1 TsaB [Anaerolineaceae bacterium]